MCRVATYDPFPIRISLHRRKVHSYPRKEFQSISDRERFQIEQVTNFQKRARCPFSHVSKVVPKAYRKLPPTFLSPTLKLSSSASLRAAPSESPPTTLERYSKIFKDISAFKDIQSTFWQTDSSKGSKSFQVEGRSIDRFNDPRSRLLGKRYAKRDRHLLAFRKRLVKRSPNVCPAHFGRYSNISFPKRTLAQRPRRQDAPIRKILRKIRKRLGRYRTLAERPRRQDTPP